MIWKCEIIADNLFNNPLIRLFFPGVNDQTNGTVAAFDCRTTGSDVFDKLMHVEQRVGIS